MAYYVKYFTLLLCICSILQSHAKTYIGVPAHEFHLSKCQIEYSETDQALQIMLHVYLDDLEEALRQQGADKLFLCSEKEHEKAEKYLFRYLQQRINMNVNGEAVEYEFVGKEQSDDLQAVWCYLEITNVTNIESIEITNNLLMEVFDDQKNVVHIVIDKNKQGYFLFHKGQESDKVTF